MADLSTVKDKLEIVQSLGPSYEMRPVASDEEVAAFEWSEGVPLPEEYRQFMLEVGNGGAGPGYGLLSLADALAERGEGVWSLADPFVPPIDAADWIDFRAPGMLPISYDGCEFYGGLAVSGPAAGTVWSYVAIEPGWVPFCRKGLLDVDGAPFEWQGSETADYVRWYEVMLQPVNQHLWMSFLDSYDDWLDHVIAESVN